MTLSDAIDTARAYSAGGITNENVIRVFGLAQRLQHHAKKRHERRAWADIYAQMSAELNRRVKYDT
jgi:hypothetical protein